MEKYHLYFDDSGVRFPDKQQLPPRNDGMDYFALGGILIKDSDRGPVTEKLIKLKAKWSIKAPLRSADIRGKRGNYKWLTDQEKHDIFFNELNSFLFEIPVIGVAAVVNRIGYNKRYEEKHGDERWWMCKTAFSILAERTAKFVDKNGGKLYIHFEGAGKKEDRALMSYAKDLKKIGLPFDPDSSSKYSFLNKEDFKRIILGEPDRLTKGSPLLQIADIFLYPMVKGGYDRNYAPYKQLMGAGKLIDSMIEEEAREIQGIKYSCFD